MGYFLKPKTNFLFFLKQKVYLAFFVAGLFFNLLIWIWLIWRVPPTADQIPLSYNIYFGIDYLGKWASIYAWPIFGLVIIIINYFLAYLIFLKNKFLSFWLINVSLLLQALILIFLVTLIINYY